MQDVRCLDIEPGLPPGSVPTLSGADAAPVSVAVFDDARPCDPRFVMERKGQGGGLPAGTYQVARPVAELLRDMVLAALGQAGFSPSPEGRGAELFATVEDLSFGVLVGFARCQMKGAVTARFRLVSADGGKVLWEAGLTGNGSAGVGDLVSGALVGALRDLGAGLARDPGFTAAALAARG